MDITLPELENAINYWRARHPAAGEEGKLSPEVSALATVYAQMIFYRMPTVPLEQIGEAARQLIEAWREGALPDNKPVAAGTD